MRATRSRASGINCHNTRPFTWNLFSIAQSMAISLRRLAAGVHPMRQGDLRAIERLTTTNGLAACPTWLTCVAAWRSGLVQDLLDANESIGRLWQLSSGRRAVAWRAGPTAPSPQPPRLKSPADSRRVVSRIVTIRSRIGNAGDVLSAVSGERGRAENVVR